MIDFLELTWVKNGQKWPKSMNWAHFANNANFFIKTIVHGQFGPAKSNAVVGFDLGLVFCGENRLRSEYGQICNILISGGMPENAF